ncbi:MAG: DoxX family protein [bacterium]|nr:DoxX family protein [bacterium]
MDKVVLIARILLGLIFTVFSANYVLNFLPMPEMSEGAGQFMGALATTGYMFPVMKAVEFGAGLLLLSGVLVPLALTLLAPIIVNIVLFNVVLDIAGLPIGLLVLALELFLAWSYRGSFRGVLAMKVEPTV